MSKIKYNDNKRMSYEVETYLNKIHTEKELKEILLDLFKNIALSDTSKRQYSVKIPQWISYLQIKTFKALLENPAESIETLESTPKIKHSPANHHIYIGSVVAYIRHITKNEEMLKKWKEYERKNSEPIADRYAENAPSELQKNKAAVPFDEIDKVRRLLPSGSPERLLIAFYTLIEPIRADYYATEIITDDLKEPTEENYIILTETRAQLVVRDFKTKERYEIIENTLSDELIEELRASLDKNPRKYLFVTDDMKVYTRKLFSNWACRALTRVLKQPMTLTALRHIYITKKIHDKTSGKELRHIATKMGHSRDMQRVYEWQS